MDACRGIGIMVRYERNFKIHLLAFLLVITLGAVLQITSFEWVLIVLVCILVLTLEAINTALEKLCNEITLERKESIRHIKDVAAGAVLIAAAGALIIAAIIFYPYLVAKTSK